MTVKFRDDMMPGDWRNADSGSALSEASRATAPLPTAWDVAKQSWLDARHVSNQSAMGVNSADIFDEVNDRIKQATNAEIANPFSGLPTFEYEPYEMWKRQVRDLKIKHPDAMAWDDIIAEPERRAYQKQYEVRQATDKMQEQLGMVQGREIPYLRNVPVVREIGALTANLVTSPLATLAQFGGGFAGSMTSPVDAGVNLLGFGAGGAAKSLLKNAAMNAAVNAVGQAPLSALKMGEYEKAGLPHGWDVWMSEVEGAASAGALIDAAVRAPVRYGRKALGATDKFGGAVLDAVPQTPKPPAAPKLDISPETFKAAEAGDIKATREILEKTGAIDNPEIRGALDHAETYGKLDAEMIARLDDMGIARADGFRIMDGLLQGRYVRGADLEADVARMNARPEPEIQPADASRVLDVTRPALDAIDPRLTDLAVHGIEARIPEVEALVRTALARLDEKDAIPADIARAFADGMREAMNSENGPRIAAQARIASGMASSVEIANLARSTPQIKSSLNPDIARHAEALALATLDDASLARVAAGDIPPSIAAHIADHVPPERQAQAIDDMVRARPESLDDAIALIDEMVPTEPREAMPLDRSGGLDDPIGAEAKSRVEAMKEEAADAVKAAQEPIKERDKLDSKVETLKGEIAKLEEKAGDKMFAMSDKDATTYAKKRGELHEAETKLAEVQARLNPDPESAQALYRVAMRAVAQRRSEDVYRAVAHAVALGRKIAPEGTKIDVRSAEMHDDATGNLLDAFYQKGESTIVLASYASDPAARMSHEVVHALVDHSLLTQAEVKLLAQEAAKTEGVFTREMRKQYAQAYAGRDKLGALLDEEAAAHLIDARMKGKAKAPENTVEGRVAQFVQRLRNLIKGYGFKTADDVAAAILNGDAARREPVRQWMRDNDVSAMAVRPEMMAAFADQNLDMSLEARKARAEAMGFEFGWLHGSPFGARESFSVEKSDRRQNSGFKGISVTRSQSEASGYSGVYEISDFVETKESLLQRVGVMAPTVTNVTRAVDTAGGKGAVFPLVVRVSNPFVWDLDNIAVSKKAALEVNSELVVRGDFPDAKNRYDFSERLESAGFDGLDIVKGGEIIERVVFDPKNIRSANAAFDPAKADSPNLMFAIADRQTGQDMRRSLDALDARLQRAKALGFDTSRVLYHGTTESFSEFRAKKLGGNGPEVVWLTPDPKIAADYTGLNYGVRNVLDHESPQIIPVYVRGKLLSVDEYKKGPHSAVADGILDRAKADGYDGVVFKNINDTNFPGDLGVTQEQVVVFSPTNIRSVNADFSPWGVGSANIMFAMRGPDALGYYSKLDEVLGSLGPKDKVTAQTLQAKGVKLAEIEARGLKDALAEGKSIPVAELMESAGRNRVELRESQKRTARQIAADEGKDYDRLRPDQREMLGMRENVKWQSHSLDPSNPTYRETVLHLPPNAKPISYKEWLAANDYPDIPEMRANFEQFGATDSTSRAIKTAQGDFHAGHFPEPNIIGHMMTSMTRHEGKPVYTIDQIQSDWGQKLRDGGVRDEGKIAEAERLYREANAKALAMEADRLPTLTTNGAEALTKQKFGDNATWATLSDEQRHDVAKLSAENTAKNTELNRRMDAAGAESDRLEAEWNTARNSAPGNPLVNTTDQWTNTTLRRAIRQAAEADAEFIAIPHGDTVLSYNPGDTEGMRGFYGSRTSEGIVPKNLRIILAKIDKDAKPVKVEKLETSRGLEGWQEEVDSGRPLVGAPIAAGFDPEQTGFTLFPLTDKVKQSVKAEGQVMFAFAGEKARTADREALSRAKDMDASGAGRLDIWNETGWFRGRDGKWRFEIDDSKSDFDLKGAMDDGWQPNQPWPLDHLLSHKSLYSAYPDMAAKGISYREFPPGYDDAGAAVSRKGDAIALNSRYRDFKNEKEMRSFALHETQHLAQRDEGFAKGGGARDFTADELVSERARLQSIQDAKPNVSDWSSFDASPAVRDMSDAMIAHSLYRRLSGEVEARAVEKRMDMTPEERKARPPWLDYDVPEDQQIVRFADGSNVSQLSYSEPPPVDGFPTIKGDVMFAIRAFHGSPHDFDRFDMKKIGTGEGAQAYGHGLYFAENEGVARSYRDKLSKPPSANFSGLSFRTPGQFRFKALPGDGVPKTFDDTTARDLIAGGSAYLDEQIRLSKGFVEMQRPTANGVANAAPRFEPQSMIDKAKRDIAKEEAHIAELEALRAGGLDLNQGRMYEVNIKAEPEDFLDWDKPLSQQSEKVKGALEKAYSGVNNKFGEPIYQGKVESDARGDALVASVAGTHGFDRAAQAAKLREAGIPGIRYLDQGSRTAGEGSRNYVVFDDSLIEILAKDGKPIEKAERQSVIDGMTAKPEGEGPMFAMADQAQPPAQILDVEYAAIDRMQSFKDLIEACR